MNVDLQTRTKESKLEKLNKLDAKPYKKLYEGLLKNIDSVNLRKLLKDYTRHWDTYIGRFLFKGISYYKYEDKIITKKDILKHIKALDLAFTVAPGLVAKTVVYRGSDRKDVRRRKIIDGKWTHKSYLSTTPTISSTLQFLDTNMEGELGCCLDQITLPKGYKVLPLFNELSHFPDECEFLLPRNTTFIETRPAKKVSYADLLGVRVLTRFWTVEFVRQPLVKLKM